MAHVKQWVWGLDLALRAAAPPEEVLDESDRAGPVMPPHILRVYHAKPCALNPHPTTLGPAFPIPNPHFLHSNPYSLFPVP